MKKKKEEATRFSIIKKKKNLKLPGTALRVDEKARNKDSEQPKFA